MELIFTGATAPLFFKALFLCVVFLVFFGIGWLLSKLIDKFINFWTSGE